METKISGIDYPLVSIISINYDHPEVTCKMLDTLKQISYPSIEVFVIDNNSPKDDPSIITEKHPWVKFISLKENLGFAGANNIGIRMAKGKYVLLLNNDTEVPAGFLEPLVDKLEVNNKIAVASPKIKFFYTPDMLQYTGVPKFNKISARTIGHGFYKPDNGQFENDSETHFAHGAAMLISMEAIRKVGMMADIFFLYYEEMDWCERFRKSGYKIYYVHNSLVYHKESVSTGKMSPLKAYYMNRARLLFLRRHVDRPLVFLSIAYLLLISFPKNTFLPLIKGRPDLFKAYHKAVMWHLHHFDHNAVRYSPDYSPMDDIELQTYLK